ncbi:hypothetical protein C0Q70_03125 [Pomacea canaliculata]|uniref:Uncharacterized protein n=1 Tax=Pomacea canaliculata TaxID=400727 RepID=A0A2T7PRV1_POMCA|nr:hypothetical protein C0Q70_03125 [Pomacea canaliculata]
MPRSGRSRDNVDEEELDSTFARAKAEGEALGLKGAELANYIKEQRQAEAEAEQRRLQAEAESEQRRLQAEAESEQRRLQAESEQRRLQAEAEQRRSQAEAEERQAERDFELQRLRVQMQGDTNENAANPVVVDKGYTPSLTEEINSGNLESVCPGSANSDLEPTKSSNPVEGQEESGGAETPERKAGKGDRKKDEEKMDTEEDKKERGVKVAKGVNKKESRWANRNHSIYEHKIDKQSALPGNQNFQNVFKPKMKAGQL